MEIHLIQGQISRMTESDSNTESLIYYLGFQLNACMLSRARLVVCVCVCVLHSYYVTCYSCTFSLWSFCQSMLPSVRVIIVVV